MFDELSLTVISQLEITEMGSVVEIRNRGRLDATCAFGPSAFFSKMPAPNPRTHALAAFHHAVAKGDLEKVKEFVQVGRLHPPHAIHWAS